MSENRQSVAVDWLNSSGTMGKLIRSMDWSTTPLGSIEHWSQSLRTTVSLCLASNFPINIIWGAERIQIYNDGYRLICGDKHPRSMGQNVKECWFSAWDAMGDAIEQAFAGETTCLENRRMFVDRNGYLEETFFTFSFSPIHDETGGVGGVFHPVTEVTQQTLAERRLKVLRDLTAYTAHAKTIEAVCRLSAEVFATHELDLPFTLFYRFHSKNHQAHLISTTGLEPGSAACPTIVDLKASLGLWGLADVMQEPSSPLRQLDDLEQQLGSFECGPYPEPPKSAMVIPIALPGLARPWGVFVAGVSSRRVLDEPYQTFYTLLGQSVTSAIANAQTDDEEALRWLAEENEDFGTPQNLKEKKVNFTPTYPHTHTSAPSRILLVDDNAAMREYVKRLLTQRWQVETAANGAIALQKIQQQLPDLVLTDVMMPEVDGFQLLKTLRADPITQSIPIIFLSARAGEAATVEGLEAGADDYLIKPFSARELVARVETQLQMSKLRQELSANRFKNEFLMTVTHELQSPLATILGWARLLQTKTLEPDAMARALATIERNATIEAKLIKDLLDVASILSGKLRLKSQIVDLAALVQNVVTTFRKTAESKNIQLVETISDQVPSNMFVDGDRLKQVIANLLENAIKFTPEGGRVTVELAVKRRVEEWRREKVEEYPSTPPPFPYVQITISDTGSGIRADFLPFAFDRFTQAEVPSRHTPGGVGIGLAIAQQIIELHHGTIEVASEGEGQGTTLIVKLPLNQLAQPYLNI